MMMMDVFCYAANTVVKLSQGGRLDRFRVILSSNFEMPWDNEKDLIRIEIPPLSPSSSQSKRLQFHNTYYCMSTSNPLQNV